MSVPVNQYNKPTWPEFWRVYARRLKSHFMQKYQDISDVDEIVDYVYQSIVDAGEHSVFGDRVPTDILWLSAQELSGKPDLRSHDDLAMFFARMGPVTMPPTWRCFWRALRTSIEARLHPARAGCDAALSDEAVTRLHRAAVAVFSNPAVFARQPIGAELTPDLFTAAHALGMPRVSKWRDDRGPFLDFIATLGPVVMP